MNLSAGVNPHEGIGVAPEKLGFSPSRPSPRIKNREILIGGNMPDNDWSVEWYPWYPKLYRADTMHLSAEQDGIYRRLIDHYMETRQPLPNNDSALSRIAGINLDGNSHSLAIAKAFFAIGKDGRLYHKRCDVELAHQNGKIRSHSERGKKGAKKRWEEYNIDQQLNGGSHSLAIDQPMLIHGREDKRREDNKEEKEKVQKEKVDLAIPDWLPKPDWKDFCEMRQRIRKPLTLRAKQLTIDDLEKLKQLGNDPSLVLQQSVKNSWQGVFALKSSAGNIFDNSLESQADRDKIIAEVRRKTYGEE